MDYRTTNETENALARLYADVMAEPTPEQIGLRDKVRVGLIKRRKMIRERVSAFVVGLCEMQIRRDTQALLNAGGAALRDDLCREFAND